MAEYYLPDAGKITEMPCAYEMKVLEKGQFEDLYKPEWSNALCADRKHLDVLCVGAYDDGKLIGLAGCSADAKEMWQIGIDVLPEYRKKYVPSIISSSLLAGVSGLSVTLTPLSSSEGAGQTTSSYTVQNNIRILVPSAYDP